MFSPFEECDDHDDEGDVDINFDMYQDTLLSLSFEDIVNELESLSARTVEAEDEQIPDHVFENADIHQTSVILL